MTDASANLAGKVAVITGAGSGIGRSCALALAQAGARIAVLDIDAARAADTAADIVTLGGTAMAQRCDVSKKGDIEAAAEALLSEFGPCNVLVNNAAVIRPGALATLSQEDWDLLLSINLTGYFLCAQVFGGQMRSRGGGSIVNVASVASQHATPMAGAYSIAKAGVTMLSRQLAVEWGKDAIRSNCVCPGLILTPFSQSMYERPGIRERREAMVPLGRIGTPDDVAKAVVFLAGDNAAYINGTELTVDGGIVQTLMSLMPRAGYE